MVSRRNILLGVTAASLAAGAGLPSPSAAKTSADQSPFLYCLNTSTIRGQKLTLPQEIELAAKAGFKAIEPWLRQIQDFVKAGGSLKDLRQRFADNGLMVVNVIAFAPWLMGDDQANAVNMETMKRDMDTVAQIGALRIAASPMGAQKLENFDLNLAARRYRQALELGDASGVMPMLEFWGSSKAMSKLSEAAYVAAAARHPKATILADVYHLYRGGSGWEPLKLIAGAALPVMHINDYPDLPPEQLNDGMRVMPGDGIAPMGDILRTLAANGAHTALSLEIFNKQYWAMEAAEVLKIAVEKIKAAVGKALGA